MLGRSLGNYQLESMIGEGGMGVVYLARHATLGRTAAVKVLHPELSTNQDIVSRFFNEARAATAVRDPGIVEVFDFGFLEDRTAYIVMEYLEGESLAARIQRGRSTIATTLTIVRAIARALQAAHDRGIVHRDLKPDNVFLVPDPGQPDGERVVLLDFGIAKLAPFGGEVSRTRTGTVMGTPTYMAPEQCRGSGQVDHRADLYALGCVAYEMLCGRPPFLADGAGDVIARHLYFPPLPLRSHHPEIPAEIDTLVLWLLEKDPAARPASAADLIRAVDHLAAMIVPISARTEPPTIQSVIRNATAPTRLPMRITTLGSAASAVTVIATPRPRRAPGIAAAAVAAIAVAAILVVVHRQREERATAPVAAAEPRSPVVAAAAPALAPAAASPIAALPSAAAALPAAASPAPARGVALPAPGSPLPVEGSQAAAVADRRDAAGDGARPRPNAIGSATGADPSDATAGQRAALTAVLSSESSHGVPRIVLSVTNRGSDPAYGVVAQLKSSSTALHGLQLSFGRIDRGETKTWTRDVAPAGAADDLDPIVVAAVTASDAPPTFTTAVLRPATEVVELHGPCKQGTLTRAAYRIKRKALQAALAAAALTQAELDSHDSALVSCIE